MFAQISRYCKAAHAPPLPVGVILALLAAIALGACGGGEGEGDETVAIGDADPEAVAVIEAWVDALREGDVEVAAGYFALPSVAENGPLVVRISDREDAIAFNESLPCGAELVSAEPGAGDFTNATFTLTDRPGGDCGAGTGGSAMTAFLVEEGKIVEWRRLDQQPDRGSSGERTT